MGYSAEHTFIVLDKQLIEGGFVHGDPHIEGFPTLHYLRFIWILFSLLFGCLSSVCSIVRMVLWGYPWWWIVGFGVDSFIW